MLVFIKVLHNYAYLRLTMIQYDYIGMRCVSMMLTYAYTWQNMLTSQYSIVIPPSGLVLSLN